MLWASVAPCSRSKVSDAKKKNLETTEDTEFNPRNTFGAFGVFGGFQFFIYCRVRIDRR